MKNLFKLKRILTQLNTKSLARFTFFLITIIFYTIQPIYSAPTKIYLMTFNSSDTDKASATQFRKSLQEALSRSEKYSLIDEDTIRNFNEKLKKQQLLGCDETICLKEIANALETEELMTGEFKKIANKSIVSLKLTVRNSETFEVGIKTTLNISFFESQKEFYIKEILKKINNPLYSINDSSAPPAGGTGISTTKLTFKKLPPQIKIPRVEKKNVSEDPSPENFFTNFVYDGTENLINKNYSRSDEIFQNAFKFATSKKINPEILSLNLRKDLVKLLPLESKLTDSYTKLQEYKEWRLTELKRDILPTWESILTEQSPVLLSLEGKKIYSDLQEVIVINYLILSGEFNELLYSSNKLEEFASEFKIYEKYYQKFYPSFGGKFSEISKTHSLLNEKYSNIEKEYLPAWNTELQKNCVTLYYASKIFPKIQNVTLEEYSETYNSLEYLYKITSEQLKNGKNALNTLTVKSCQGIK